MEAFAISIMAGHGEPWDCKKVGVGVRGARLKAEGGGELLFFYNFF